MPTATVVKGIDMQRALLPDGADWETHRNTHSAAVMLLVRQKRLIEGPDRSLRVPDVGRPSDDGLRLPSERSSP